LVGVDVVFYSVFLIERQYLGLYFFWSESGRKERHQRVEDLDVDLYAFVLFVSLYCPK